MPKFNGQNKKRNNPRYFLNETVEKKEEIKEGEKERTWDDAYAMGLPEPEFRAPWNSTKDMIDKLGEQAREASKAIYGYKVDVGNMTLDQIQDLLYDMSNSDAQRAMDDEAQREDDMAIGMQDDELDNSPKRMGMGRMEEEEKPKKKEKEPDPGKYDNYNGKPEKCDYVPCGDRKPKTSKKKDKLKEMIEEELVSLLNEDRTESQIEKIQSLVDILGRGYLDNRENEIAQNLLLQLDKFRCSRTITDTEEGQKVRRIPPVGISQLAGLADQIMKSAPDRKDSKVKDLFFKYADDYYHGRY